MASASPLPRSDDHSWLAPGCEPFAGKYAVERILGQGGMGVVFEARHVRIGQRVAIKVLGSTLREFPELVERFEREARACGSLSSAHAVRVFDIDATEDGTPYIVMELLAGRDLAQLIGREGPQPVSRCVRWIIEACDAIAEAHRLGIVHRDLKPSNLFLSNVEGRSLVKVLDFGIAKRLAAEEASITQAVCPLGTPQYMSPEQVRCAKDVDVRTDVWSLGVTLYELVTGTTPFPHESSSACIAAIAADPVPDPRLLRPDLPGAFVEVLMGALRKDASERYQSIEELVAAIAPFAAVEEDEEVVTAVRRAFASVPAACAGGDRPTLDEPAPVFVAATPSAGGADHTPSPAIRLVTPPPQRRRFASGLAVASAAALGVAVLVLSPRAARSPIAITPPSLDAEKAAGAPRLLPVGVLAPSARADGPTEQVELAVVAAAAMPVAPPAAPARAAPSTSPTASTDVKRQLSVAPRDKSDKLPQAVASRSVHGGLSNPGF